MSKPYYLFVLDKPDATDQDYENCDGPGSYVVYGVDGSVVETVEGLEEAERLVEALSKAGS